MTGLVDTSRPYATAAADYLPTGLGIPVPLNGKILQLGGVTGDEGHAGPADVDRWLDRYGAANLGIVLDETVVGVDVDHGYAGHNGRVKHGHDTITGLEATLGPLPPTVSSTSRHDTHPDSRIRFYRVTAADGAALRGNVDLRLPGQADGDVEVIHHRYRYVAAWPSVHPDTGDTYEWYAPDGTPLGRLPDADFDLPDLPEAWVRHLVGLAVAKRGTSYGRATRAEVDAALTGGQMDPDLADLVRRFWTEEIDHGHGAEDESDLLGMTSRLARLAAAGRPGSRTAVELARSGYTRPPYGDERYGRAFDAAFAGSVRFWTKWQEETDVIRGAMFPADAPDPAGEDLAAGEHAATGEAGTTTETDETGQGEGTWPVYDRLTDYDRLHEQEVARELERRLVRADVDRIVAEREATAVTMPAAKRLDRFLDEPDDDPEWRVEGLLPTGGNVLLAAQYKTGKSTAVLNLVRSLADGDPLFGEFDVQPGTVCVIDDEMDERQWRRRLRQQGVHNTTRVTVVPIRGQVATLNILDPLVRARWADLVAGHDVLVFDCLRPALDALGLSEDKEAGRFLVALDALKKEAGVQEMVAVTHAGHDGQRARGDSRLLDWPDANWKLLRQRGVDDEQAATDPNTPREFEAYGREVNVPARRVVHDEATQRWTLAEGRAPAAGSAEVQAATLAHVQAHPGDGKNQVTVAVTALGHTKPSVHGALGWLERAGRIYRQQGANRSYEFHPADHTPGL